MQDGGGGGGGGGGGQELATLAGKVKIRYSAECVRLNVIFSTKDF